jgi:hypothetical protein
VDNHWVHQFSVEIEMSDFFSVPKTRYTNFSMSSKCLMSRIQPVDFHGFTESLEFLFIERNRSCRRARIMTPLNDQQSIYACARPTVSL